MHTDFRIENISCKVRFLFCPFKFWSSMLWWVCNRCVLVHSSTWACFSFNKSENWVWWRLPTDSELLDMDDFIGINNFIDYCSDLLFIHWPNHVKSSLVWLLKSSEFLLQFFELDSNSFVLLSQFNVIILIHEILLIESILVLSQCFLMLSVSLHQRLLCCCIDLFSLIQNLKIELKLCLI